MKIYLCGTVPPNWLTEATETVNKEILKTMNQGDYSSQSKKISWQQFGKIESTSI